jgi:hypothetical protein
LEAEECSKLLGFIIFHGCNSPKSATELKEELLGSLREKYEPYRNK